MKHLKAKRWQTSQPLTAPARAGVRTNTPASPVGVTDHTAENPNVATAIVEQRFGNRADRLLRRFSWEDDQ